MGKQITENEYEAAVAGWVLERAREEKIKDQEEVNTMNEVYGKFKHTFGNIDRSEEEIRNATRSIDIDIGDIVAIKEKQEPTKDDVKAPEEHKEEQKNEIEDNER